MTKHGIWIRLQGDSEFLKECIIMIYNLQTSHEKMVKSTTHTNDVGFNKADSFFMTQIAERLRDNIPVSEDDLLIASEKMGKYAGQIASIIKSAKYDRDN